jgi:hypothetical protein
MPLESAGIIPTQFATVPFGERIDFVKDAEHRLSRREP